MTNPANKLSDLLPIDDANASPHAYEVFGLDAGESDMAKVSSAVQETVNRLRSLKSETTPELWKKAAQMVQAARVTLADPLKKAELDARFGIVSFDDMASDPPPAKIDPLAGLLPTSNPLAPVMPAAATPTNKSITGIFGTAPETPTSLSPPRSPLTPTNPIPSATQDAASPRPVIRTTRPATYRRKRSWLSTLMIGTFFLGMLGLIAALTYFLFFGPGTLAITSKDGELIISTGPSPQSPPSVVAQPRSIDNDGDLKNPEVVDPVMGKLGGYIPNPSAPSRFQPIAPEQPPSQPITESAEAMPTDPMPTDPMPSEAMATDTIASDVMPAEITDEMSSEVDEALVRVADTIRGAKWATMKVDAGAVQEMPMKPDQQELADGLFHVADLASYYRGAIEKTITDAKVDEVEVTGGMQVRIIERKTDGLIVFVNGRSRTYTLDQLPFPLAHKLAEFSIDDTTTRQASKAAYLAIVPNTNEGYRDEAIQTLNKLSGQVEGANTEQMVRAIKHLYPSGQ